MPPNYSEPQVTLEFVNSAKRLYGVPAHSVIESNWPPSFPGAVGPDSHDVPPCGTMLNAEEPRLATEIQQCPNGLNLNPNHRTLTVLIVDNGARESVTARRRRK